MAISFFDGVPIEIQKEIFSWLSSNDLTQTASVCQQWHKLSKKDSIWQNITKKYLENPTYNPSSIQSVSCKKHGGWKGIYCRVHKWNHHKDPNLKKMSTNNITELFASRLVLSKSLGLCTGDLKIAEKIIADFITESRFQNFENDEFQSPINFILSRKHVGHYTKKFPFQEVVNLFLNTGFNISVKEASLSGNSPLHIATKNRDLFVIKELVKRGLNINVTNLREKTPLFYSIDHLETMSLLIQLGANVNHFDNQGLSLLCT